MRPFLLRFSIGYGITPPAAAEALAGADNTFSGNFFPRR
jgi:hypothetical protein